ncbi:MAG TPA: glutamine--fructose-6-phosphate transaminase (isomerizing) [Synergistales bacterium]|nr:glutamine--fructose-6-phosphate transaminase (isomerizing) [Synergistales bacterium]HRV70669.1 glutamine--fructose-6-phosphate transaminase (isomerizing) [Thermovirgaceae bacterium]
MCGIVGYVGKRNASDVLVDGLKRLEYRGYDSAGLALRTEEGILILKEVGKVADLEALLGESSPVSTQGIGHTRWATHGGVTQANAHPHRDGSGKFAIVHNGIIENFMELKEELEMEGVTFLSETDTEAVVHMIARTYSDKGDMLATLVALQKKLRGSFALVVIQQDFPDRIYCVRRGSPLVVGSGEGESFCASDVPAFLPFTRKVQYLEEGDIAEISLDGIKIWNEDGVLQNKPFLTVDWDVSMTEKSGFSHYMLKEIHEQGMVLRSTLKGRIQEGRTSIEHELGWDPEMVARWNRIHVIACGTSFYAAQVAERVFEKWTDFDIKVDIASEYRYRHIRCDSSTLAIFVSQSGETADTIAAQRKARAEGAHCLAITNVRGSTLAREVHSVLLLKAGPEIGVAATKTFSGQMAALFLVALQLGRMRNSLCPEEEERLLNEFLQIPYKVEILLEREQEIKELAEKYAASENFLFIGRGISFPVALEGALKLKEISYVHAEAYAAGEMKHGPIALLEPAVPVLSVIPRDGLYEKTLSNIQEAKARRSPLIAVCTEGDQLISKHVDDCVYVPWTDEEFSPFLTVVPLQFLAFHIALLKGREIDQPRNLAKSVTVE